MPSMITGGENLHLFPHAVGDGSFVKGGCRAAVEGSCLQSSPFPLTDPRS